MSASQYRAEIHAVLSQSDKLRETTRIAGLVPALCLKKTVRCCRTQSCCPCLGRSDVFGQTIRMIFKKCIDFYIIKHAVSQATKLLMLLSSPWLERAFFTWATACGAPLNAAVETTLTAPPPSSRPSRGWSVTWTTRYVTCKTKDRLHKKDTLGKKYILCVTVHKSQKHKKAPAVSLTLVVDLFIMSISFLQQSLQSKC